MLTSGRTGSAGEATAIVPRGQAPSRVFGTPTDGPTTANRTHVLRDGTRLWISGRSYADAAATSSPGPDHARCEPCRPGIDGESALESR